MAFSSSTTINFKITFDNVDKTFYITDTSDYSGQGVALFGLTGTVNITDPMGNFYSTSIIPSTSLNSSDVTPLPDSDDNFIMGIYEVEYSVTDNTYTVDLTKEFDLDFTSPEVEVSMTFDSILPLLTSSDDTDYMVGGIQPTITRTHTLKYPPSTGEADYTVSTVLLETSTAYTLSGEGLQHTGYVSSDLVYEFDDDFFITDTIEGYGYINVFADESLCQVYCCIKSSWTRYQNARCKSKFRADEELAKLYEITMNANLMRNAMLCGKSADITSYYEEILRIGECSGDCECSDGEPILVTGLGSSTSSDDGQSYFVVSSNSAISVATSTVGTNTTYTVTFSNTLLTKLNALYNTTIVGGTGISVSYVSDVDLNRTYTINNTGTATEPEYMAFDLIIDNTNVGAIPTLTIDNVVTSGTQFTGSPAANWMTFALSLSGGTVDTTPSTTQFQNEHVKILIDNIFDSAPSVEFPKFFINVKKVYSNSTGATTSNVGALASDNVYKNFVSPVLSIGNTYLTSTSDLLSIDFRYGSMIGYATPTGLPATGNIFYRTSTSQDPYGNTPALYVELSILIML